MTKRIAYLVAFMALAITECLQAKTINVSSFSLAKGESSTFAVLCDNNNSNLVSFQMDLQLPEGLELDIDNCKLGDRVTDSTQELFISDMSGGKYRILTSSYNLTPISGHSGALIHLAVTATDDFVGGEAILYNMKCASSTSVLYTLADESFDISLFVSRPSTILGDINEDGVIDMTDISLLVDYILGIKRVPSDIDCDINGDGVLDVSDVMALTDLLLQK